MEALEAAIADARRRGEHEEAGRLEMLREHWAERFAGGQRRIPPLHIDREPPLVAGGQGEDDDEASREGEGALWPLAWTIAVAVCAVVWWGVLAALGVIR